MARDRDPSWEPLPCRRSEAVDLPVPTGRHRHLPHRPRHISDRPALTVNFRTTEPVIEWINDIFGALIVAEPGSQAEYVALSAHRQESAPVGPAVDVLAADTHAEKLSADELRTVESRDIAAAVSELLHGPSPWSVDDGEGGWRSAIASDVCILLPTRTSLSALETALTAVGVPYRAETTSLVYAARESREVLLALAAVADPPDEDATVAALRSFVYGCGDDDLAHWRLGVRGRFTLRAPIPEGQESHPVALGLQHLQQLHEARLWSTPAELLDRLIRERGVLETAIAGGNPRDVWRRLRFVIDQARAWVDAGGVDLRAYLRWARLQGADNARVSETVLPETDDDSVRIMTIHGSKGLEFPITVLAGMTTKIQKADRGVDLLPTRQRPGIALVVGRHLQGIQHLEIHRRPDERTRTPPTPLRRRHTSTRSPDRLAASHRVDCVHRSVGHGRTRQRMWGIHAVRPDDRITPGTPSA